MDINEAKEAFADILISFQRGEVDLPTALMQIRDYEPIDEEVPEYDEDEDEAGDEDGEQEDGDAEDAGDGDPVDDGDGVPAVDEDALALAEAELDAALAVVDL